MTPESMFAALEALARHAEIEASPTYDGALDVPAAPRCVGCGLCCMNFPGGATPDDLGPDWRSEAARRLATGRWVVDGAIDDDGRWVHALRPARVTEVGRVFAGPPEIGGACAFLGETGCTLSRSERPTCARRWCPAPDAVGCAGMSARHWFETWNDRGDELLAVAHVVDGGTHR